MKAKILLYEDNDNLRLSLRDMLERDDDYTVIGHFPECTGFEVHLEHLEPDVILMDIDLPGMSGIKGVEEIRRINKDVHIIMLTVFDDKTSIYEALYAGANGYILKPQISERLTFSIQDVLKGGAPMSPAIARKILDNIVNTEKPKSSSDYHLTSREHDVLVSLGKGNSYKMVAADLEISIDTVRSHIKNIYDKLHVQSQGEAISKAIREGLID